MAKTEKPAASASQAKGSGKAPAQQTEASGGAAKSKGKKPLIIAVAILVLAIGGGAGWYFTKGKGDHGEAAKKAAPEKLKQPKFVPLEAFTVNLQRGEEGDQFLQAGITLKIDEPALEEKIKQAMPEIRSRILMLLSGKRASDLVPVSGKKQLAQEILLEANTALGIKPAKAKGTAAQGKPASGVMAGEHAVSGVVAHAGAASSPAGAEAAAEEEDQAAGAEQESGQEEAGGKVEEARGILDVLFTSFIIQ